MISQGYPVNIYKIFVILVSDLLPPMTGVNDNNGRNHSSNVTGVAVATAVRTAGVAAPHEIQLSQEIREMRNASTLWRIAIAGSLFSWAVVQPLISMRTMKRDRSGGS